MPAETKVADAGKPAEPAKPAEAPKPAEAAKPAPPKPAAAKKAPPPPPPEPDLMDQVMDNLPVIVGGVGVLGALGLGGFLFMRRRRQREEVGPSSSMTSAFPSDLKPSTGTGKAGGGLADTGNSSFLTDFDKTGPGTIDTDEVDPVAAAEVYIAYGRDAQAIGCGLLRAQVPRLRGALTSRGAGGAGQRRREREFIFYTLIRTGPGIRP